MQNGTLQGIIENLPDACVSYDAAGQFIACNRKYRDLFPEIAAKLKPGVRRADLVADYAQCEPTPIVNQDATEWLRERLATIARCRPVTDRELSDGRWIRISESRTDDGGILCVLADITDLVRKISDIQEKESRFQDFAGANADWFWEMDENLRFTHFHDMARIFNDSDRERFIGLTRRELVDSDENDAAWKRHQGDLDARQPFRDFCYRVLDRNSQARYWSISGKPIFDETGRFTGYRGSGTDITARIQIEEGNAEQSALLQQILDNIPLSVSLFDPEGRYIFINAYGAAKSDRSIGDFVGRKGEDIFGIPAEKTSGEFARQVARTGQPVVNAAVKPSQWPGRNVVLNAVPHYGLSGEMTGVLVLIQDVTERIQAQEAARERETYLQAVVDNLPANLSLKDLDGRYQLVNDRLANFFGLPRERILGRTNFEIENDGASATIISAQEKKTMETRTSVITERLVEKENGPRSRRITKFPVFGEDGQVVSIGTVSIDTTEQKKIEEQLRQAQKMEAVGQLTGGIAHDFNNLLGVVVGNLDILDEDFGKTPVERELIATAIRAALHGAELTRQLLAFSRQQPLAPKVLDLNQQIGGMLELLRRTLGETIEVELVRGGGLWLCNADPSQVEAALLNLAINARDAMPVGGALTVETANVRLDSDYADAQEEVTPGQYVMLAITDTGAGMTDDVKRRAFEPFFTTKNIGEGSGLGLSMVFGFAKQSGGHVAIYSEEGHGTTVKLYLPRALDAAKPDSRLPAAAAPTGQGELILVVEDDTDLRDLTVKQLHDLGYETTAARDGKSALAAFEAAGRIDLLLTDVVLPGGMGGTVLAHEIARRQPAVKILFMSGYTENAIVHQGRLDQGVNLLQKPFRKTDLARMTHAALTAED